MGRGYSKTGPTLSSPVWCADFLSRDHLVPAPAKLVAASFLAEDAVVVTTDAEALADAETISVEALSGAIPSGTILDFGAKKFAQLTAAAAAGATSLAVEALATTIASGDSATYAGAATVKAVRSGTVVGRTYAEAAAGTGFGPVADADDEVYIVVFDVDDVSNINDVELYRHGSGVKQNFLPQYADLSATVLGKLRAAYVCFNGAA